MSTYNVIDLWAGDTTSVVAESPNHAAHLLWETRYSDGHSAQSEMLRGGDGRIYYQLTARDDGDITIGVRIDTIPA